MQKVYHVLGGEMVETVLSHELLLAVSTLGTLKLTLASRPESLECAKIILLT